MAVAAARQAAVQDVTDHGGRQIRPMAIGGSAARGAVPGEGEVAG